MDIIDQRLQNINQMASARKNRSMSESDLNVDETMDTGEITSTAMQSTPQLSHTKLSEVQCTENNKESSLQRSNECSTMDTTKAVVKKRKLFAPPSLFGSITEINSVSQDRSESTPTKTDSKKTVASSGAAKKRDANDTKISSIKKFKTIHSKTPTKTKLVSEDAKSTKRRQSSMDFISCTSSKTKTVLASEKPIINSVLPSLVTTNMHRAQQQFCKEVGKF